MPALNKEKPLSIIPGLCPYPIMQLPLGRIGERVSQVPKEKLISMVQTLFQGHDKRLIEELIEDLPNGWERFDDVALLPLNAFSHKKWNGIDHSSLWAEISNALNVNRLFRKGEITGERRESSTELLHGTNVDVERIEHGVKFVYRITECMFSQGNLNERKRMGDLDLSKEEILDLYAGIGYYTLPMLVRGNAKHVTATEWNPNALRDLRKGLERNGVNERCTVLEGDNRSHGSLLDTKFDRIILGLLPQAWDGLDTAMRALRSSGGILHVHGVASTKNPGEWENEVTRKLFKYGRSITKSGSLRIKSYAPFWDHRVLDIEVGPLSSDS